jgi:hypothetical protein
MAQAAIDATEGHPDQLKHLSSLGLSLRERYIRTGEMADLDLALQATQKAVENTPPNHRELARRLNNLVIQLGERYKRTGTITDLNDTSFSLPYSPSQRFQGLLYHH